MIHITSGDCLNEIIEKKYNISCIPFREAMIKGTYNSEVFSMDFCKERAKVHNVSLEEYIEKLTPFLEVLKNLNTIDEIQLWFGDEPFCQENRKVIKEALKSNQYKGRVILHIVDEEIGSILETREVLL